MLQSTNEPTRVSPTERRIIHEEVQKMLDEGIVQPSESPWSSPIVLSLLKSGVEFHWDLKRWKHLTVLSTYFGSSIGDVRRKRASTKSILMQAGTVSGCPSTNSE
ncbi:hypothetical protein TNCV_1477971 [Trichonephila clavipes]|nr:hypothetical protein TNCV_1477971 [Trichonephila clavipes]